MVNYLIDTNTAIDYLNDKLPENISELLDKISISLSVIVRMELLSWKKASVQQVQVLQQFINSCKVYNLDEPIILRAIELRKQYPIKLPDAIIASTGLTYKLTLITRNLADFKRIEGLNIIDSYSS